MRKLLLAGLLALVIGCVGSPEPRHPYRDGRSQEQPWWRTPYTADTPRDQNPWLAFVPEHSPNEFDPWAADDLQRYSVSPVITGSVAVVDTTTPSIEAPRIYFLRLRAKQQREARRARQQDQGSSHSPRGEVY